jgi:hypothetical protein
MYRLRNTDHWLLLVRRKLPQAHWLSLVIHVIGTERRAQVRPYIGTIEAMDRTSGQSQVKLRLLRSISLPILPLYTTDIHMLGNAMIMSFMTYTEGYEHIK